MTRRITIKVVNTGNDEKWVLESWHLEHGKWMADSPPSEVSENGTATIRSEKTTGSMYGTTGWIKYKSSIQAGSTLTITWNKPYGKDPTTCNVDINSQQYTAEVTNKDFQESEAFCDVVISKITKPVTDTKSWMGKLPAGTLLNRVMMPGSHDAGMSQLEHCSVGATDSNTLTQQLDIKDQLEAGSRYFDIRVDYDHNELVTYHRTGPLGCNGQALKAVLDQAIGFLSEQRTETAILKISHIRGEEKSIMLKIRDMLLSEPYNAYLYKGADDNLSRLKVSDLAGKILAVMDYDEQIDASQGFFRYHDGFPENSEVCSFEGLNMTVCDKYAETDSYTKMAANQIEKWDKYAGFGKDYLFLLSWTLTAGAMGSIRDLAKEANDNLPNVLAQQINVENKQKLNIVYIDFVNVDTTRTIIDYNFQ